MRILVYQCLIILFISKVQGKFFKLDNVNKDKIFSNNIKNAYIIVK